MSGAPAAGRRPALILHAADDVAVLTQDARAGDGIVARGGSATVEVVARGAISSGHKVLLCARQAGAHIRKYGEVIGRLTADAEPGEHIHVHNLASMRAGGGSGERIAPDEVEVARSG